MGPGELWKDFKEMSEIQSQGLKKKKADRMAMPEIKDRRSQNVVTSGRGKKKKQPLQLKMPGDRWNPQTGLLKRV